MAFSWTAPGPQQNQAYELMVSQSIRYKRVAFLQKWKQVAENYHFLRSFFISVAKTLWLNFRSRFIFPSIVNVNNMKMDIENCIEVTEKWNNKGKIKSCFSFYGRCFTKNCFNMQNSFNDQQMTVKVCSGFIFLI